MSTPAARAAGHAIFLRTIAAGFATAITTTFWDRRAAMHQTHLAEASSAFDPALQQSLAHLHAQGLSDSAAFAVMNRELVGQACLLSSVDHFWISAIASAAMIALVWLARRPGRSDAVVATD